MILQHGFLITCSRFARFSLLFAICGLMLATIGCNQNRYQPADWRVTRSSTTMPVREGGAVGTTLPGRWSGSTLPARGSTLPMRGSTLPMRGTTLPMRGTTLPGRAAIGSPASNSTLPGRLIIRSQDAEDSTTLPSRIE